MSEGTEYYVIRKKAVPEVLLKVVEVQKILDADPKKTVQMATSEAGISRSSYYKYKEDIFPFHDSRQGRNITCVIEIRDCPGIISTILNIFAKYQTNILTIHQSIPINGVGILTLSVDILSITTDVSAMLNEVESLDRIISVKIIARE
ncbi:MAG: ACT domain-containing protein [Lachnospiraceae bacterium]|nr:ACT domain-containing protein [Lachnospiraceae bacterium]